MRLPKTIRSLQLKLLTPLAYFQTVHFDAYVNLPLFAVAQSNHLTVRTNQFGVISYIHPKRILTTGYKMRITHITRNTVTFVDQIKVFAVALRVD